MGAVEKVEGKLDVEFVAKIESPQAFNYLLPVFRQASKEKIVAVLKAYPDIL